MKHRRIHLTGLLGTAFSFSMLLLAGNLVAQQPEPGNSRSIDSNKARVVEYWTSERKASAIPRDLVIDARGLGYLRKPDGSLEPYGHQVAAAAKKKDPTPLAKPPGAGGSNDNTPPSISDETMDPGEGAVIGASHTFSVKVTDDIGLKSVSFTIGFPDESTTQTFSANAGANDLWTVTLSGFTDGAWNWWVVAKDTAKKGGNTATSEPVNFMVETGGGGEPPDGNGDTVANAEWTYGDGGKVQTAAGRLYFEMPKNAKRKGPWGAFVCSGTAVTDGIDDRSVILTAAHCVYDDANKAFARNVLFIPDQAGTTGSGTDLDCDNDPLGCWVPSFGVVDTDWTALTFPDNIRWDYAYYVVAADRAHAGDELESESESLEDAAGTLAIDFGPPDFNDGTPGANSDDFTYGLGYSYNADPNFMYCADDMTTEGTDNWWLPNCELSGGSSGGPWIQPMDTTSPGDGPVISVNSWGYIGSPGMAGPKLSTPAACVFDIAGSHPFIEDSEPGDAGVAVDCS